MRLTQITPLIKQHAPQIERVITWAGPPLIIPALRFSRDDPEHRNELFVRDFSSWSIGSAGFLGGSALSAILLKKLPQKLSNTTIRLTSFLVGFTIYCLYSGIGALKLSKWFNNKQNLNIKRENTPILNAYSLSKDLFQNNNLNKTQPPTTNYKLSGVFKTGNYSKFNFTSYLKKNTLAH